MAGTGLMRVAPATAATSKCKRGRCDAEVDPRGSSATTAHCSDWGGGGDSSAQGGSGGRPSRRYTRGGGGGGGGEHSSAAHVTIAVLLLLVFTDPSDAVVYNWLGIALGGAHVNHGGGGGGGGGAASTPHEQAAQYEWSDYDEPNGNMWPTEQQYAYYGYDIAAHPVCAQMNLNEMQREICARKPHSMPLVSDGARTGIFECQYQFKYERWNCSNIQEDANDLLGPTMRAGNKETAFVSAVTSAGVVYQMTRGCSLGALTECGCDNNYRGRAAASAGDGAEGSWHWGGCSDNVKYGTKFSEQFLDAWEQQQYASADDRKVAVLHLMNLHNHRVGRESVRAKVKRLCRCHGVSGSCGTRVCWRRMASFNEIGDLLKSRYDYYAVRIAKRAKTPLRRKDRSVRDTPIHADRELVYLHRSPNYCSRDETAGVFGTTGRVCNVTSVGRDSCDLLCCGRGYDTSMETWEERCHCKFVWCCEVKCKLCTRTAEVHTCK